MRNCFLAMLILVALGACKNNKVSPEDGEQVALNTFLDAFPVRELPLVVSDTNIATIADTTTLSKQVFSHLIPDSILKNEFTETGNLSFHPVAKFKNKQKETYLVTLVSTKNKSAVYLLVLDDTLHFSASLPLLVSDNDKNVLTTTTIDKKYGVTLYNEWKANEVDYYQRDTYAYNNVGTFTLVLNETNDFSKKPLRELNPLDTFPKKNKLSGDYYRGKTNFISIRDGKDEQNYRFYVYFKNEGEDECGGELRGDLKITSATTGVYKENSDPCIIDFTFTGNKVKCKETGSCGNYRGIKCFFNDTYTKKKEPKPAKKRK